jgi:hypothetical protein
MIFQNYSSNGNNLIPIVNVNPVGDNEVKLNEDDYEVFVNDQFVGHKTLKNQGESLSDIDDFLRYQGLNDFTCSLDGDHYNIISSEQSNDITDALTVYFNNR